LKKTKVIKSLNLFIEKIEKTILTNVILLVYLLFSANIEVFLTKNLVKTLLSLIKSTVLNDILFISISLIIVLYIISKISKSYTISFNTLYHSTLIILIYAYYRFINNSWDFSGLTFITHLKYLDIIPLFFFSNIYLYFFTSNKITIPKGNDGFNIDSPLGNSSLDLLNREALAKNLSFRIKNTSSPDASFAIGISSEWGNGKTSFLDLLLRSLEDPENIIIKFNPWMNHHSGSIIKEFFNLTNVELSKYHSSASHTIKKYSDLLTGINDHSTTKFLNPFIKHLSKESTVLDEFLKIDRIIKSIGKRVIIFIDDLDRLHKNEIIEVIKLIRNSANFGNTTFIVAYDRSYVTKALKDINDYNPEGFLEKIFQLEIRLPNFEQDVLTNRLKGLIEPHLNDADKNELTELLSRKILVLDQDKFHLKSLSTLRDVTRFSNSFLVSYTFLKGEVIFTDLLNLEILRLKYPSIYNLIFFNSNKFLETSSRTLNKTVYTLKFIKTRDNKDTSELIAENFLVNNFQLYGIRKNEVYKVIEILLLLFPNTSNNYTQHGHKQLSLSNPISFERYSYYRLLDNDLSEISFSNSRMRSIDHFKNQIDTWITLGLRSRLKKRFEHIEHFNDKADFEKVIQAIYYLARQPSQLSIENDFSGFDFNSLYYLLNRGSIYVKLGYYTSIEEYQKFVFEILKSSPSPYIFDCEFIYHIIKNHSYSYNFIIPLKDLQSLRFSYLKSYLSEAVSFDQNVWSLYHHNDQFEISYTNESESAFTTSKTKDPLATKAIINFIENKALDEFLFAIINYEHFNNETFSLSGIIPEMFGDYEGLTNFISTFNQDDYKYLKEFKEFNKKLKEINYTNFISFDFKAIPIQKKLNN
jgi:hypothetical protein